MMKKKLLILNLISYVILNFIILDVIMYQFKEYLSVYGQFKNVIEGSVKINDINLYPISTILSINIVTSLIFFYVAYKWYLKENIFRTFLRLIASFVLINLIVWIIEYFIHDYYLHIFSIIFISLPTSIMILIILPLFTLNNKIAEKI